MQSRIPSPALTVAGALDAFQTLGKLVHDAADKAGVPQSTIELVSLRASQINGCAVCLDMHTLGAQQAGETDERLRTLVAWRDTPYFDGAERAALALAEVGTRLADHDEAVSDAVFDEAAKHYDDQALSVLVMAIATINAWNRLNVISGLVTGEWVKQWVA